MGSDLNEINSLPNAEPSERNILGAILIDESLLEKVKGTLTPDRFYNRMLQQVYTAMLDMRDAGETITPVGINARNKALEVHFVTQLSYGATDLAWKRDIDRIISASRRRWVLKFAERLEARTLEGEETEDDLLAYAASQIDSARTKLAHRAKIRFLDEMIDDQASRYRQWHKGVSDAIPTGFGMLDEKLQGGGLVPSGLYVLGARPSMGKSALALDIAANVAQEGRTVHIVSREMPAESLFDRLHAANAGVPRWMLRAGIYQREYQKLISTLPQVCQLPIALDNLSLTVPDIRANFREMERKHRRPSLLIVDYVQLVDGPGRSRNDEVGSVTRGLKGMAMEFQIPVLALSQLSRECDKQKREPEMSDLRDSGEVEQDADAVFLLFGERPEEGAKIYGRQFKCAKQRDGELFTRELTFNGDLVTFRSFDQLAVGIQQTEAVA